MKKHFIILLTSFMSVLLSLPANAQSGWISREPYPTGDWIFGVSCINKNTCIIVGYSGIQKTTDGGKTWITQDSGIIFAPSSICFTDSLNGTIVGNKSIILHTTDGGTTWTEQTNPFTQEPIYFNCVSFTNKNNGTVVGDNGQILRTTNGGITWSSQNSGTTSVLRGVSFVDSLNGIAVGEGCILQTNDAGLTWNLKDFGHGFTSVSYTDINHAVAVGDYWTSLPSVILRTTDGGNNWNELSSPYTGFIDDYKSVSFTDKDNGTIISDYSIIRTTDGGTSWTVQSANFGTWLKSVSFSDMNNGFIVGAYGILLHTTDGGAHWDDVQNGTPFELRSISMTSTKIGTAVGEYGTILRTKDGGITWHRQKADGDFHGVFFIDDDNGIAVGNKILYTTDGGQSWNSPLLIEKSYFALMNISLINKSTGIAVGTEGTILKTTDGGLNWFVQTSGTNNTLYSIVLYNENTGCAVGQKGVILTTNDGGVSWQKHAAFDSTITLKDVSFIKENKLAIVGDYGTIRISDDGGLTWYIKESPTSEFLNGIDFTDENNGIIVGGLNGVILKTTNGGNNWGTQVCPSVGYPLNDVSMFNNNDAIIVGYGIILRTSDGGGIVAVKNNTNNFVPQNYSLSQNYPNPFNPSTTIEYTIPGGVETLHATSLRIFDVLGREVAKLVNDEKPAGSYSVTFNVETFHGSSLPSGIYFYQLCAGDYAETKKMVLIK